MLLKGNCVDYYREMASVFLALPRYKISRDDRAEVGLRASTHHQLTVQSRALSLLACNCNLLLCDALNKRAYHWFAMLHDDITPEQGWLDKLIDEAERCEADLLSAVVPLKDDSGCTSTAIGGEQRSAEAFTRLTQAQVLHPGFPRTFDMEAAAAALERLPVPYGLSVPRTALWCNTGCMVCRIDRDWDWSRVNFAAQDGLVRRDGRWLAITCPEDWLFSQRVADAGGKVMATTIVELVHWEGDKPYHSRAVWGRPRD